MEMLKIEMKIGDREFRGEGPTDVVREQASAFMKLTCGGNAESLAVQEAEYAAREAQFAAQEAELAAARKALAAAQEAADTAARAAAAEKAKQPPPFPFEKIMKAVNRRVSISVPTKERGDALLVILLGQKELRNNPMVYGIDLLYGMRASGHSLYRVDTFLQTLEKNKYITSEGKRRQRRYQLTQAGLMRAQKLAHEYLGLVPTLSSEA